MKCYGQEINPLSTAIGKMNLFLNGVTDFKIVNADTLKHPAFIENRQLKQFDIVLANPPYSISEWSRYDFETDQYGRNFLGTPPQGNADYAFFQHILKSLKPNGGRCAILFPHGVLTRDDEYEMRKKLIKIDWIECIIGIGKNLFYNSPMEACIVICNTNKTAERKGKILFINAKNEVTRKNAQSYLEDTHIQHIAGVFNDFAVEELFSNVATIEYISEEKNDFSLGISKYVTGAIDPPASKEELDMAITRWISNSTAIHDAYKKVNELIVGGDTNA
jgi:type I restriction enzyme M protein